MELWDISREDLGDIQNVPDKEFLRALFMESTRVAR